MADLNVGTIEAVLKVKDEATATFQKASTELNKFAGVTGKATDETKKLEAATGAFTAKSGGMSSAMSGMTSVLLRYVGPMVLGAAVARTIEWGDSLEETSQATGVSTTKLQQLTYAATQSGMTFDNLVASINQLNNRLGSGDKSAIAAVEKLGLSFKILQTMSPDQQMLAIGNALRDVGSAGDRTAIAMDLFGQAGGRLIPTLTGLNELMEQAPVLADDEVQALSNLAKAWDALKTRSAVALGSMVGGILQLVSVIKEANLTKLTMLSEQQNWQLLSALGVSPAAQAQAAGLVGLAGAAVSGGTAPVAPLAPTLAMTEAYKAEGIEADRADREVKQLNAELKRLQTQGERAARAVAQLSSGFTGIMSVLPTALEQFQAAIRQTEINFNTPPPLLAASPIAGLTGAAGIGLAGTVPTQNIAAQFGEANRATQTWTGSLGRLSQAFSELAQISDGAMSDVMRIVGQGISTFALVGKSLQELDKAEDALQAASTAGEAFSATMTGLGAAVSAAMGVFGLLYQVMSAWNSQDEKTQANLKKSYDLIRNLREGAGGTEALRESLALLGTDWDRWNQLLLENAGNLAYTTRNTQALQAALDALADAQAHAQKAADLVATLVEDWLTAVSAGAGDVQARFGSLSAYLLATFGALYQTSGDFLASLEAIGPALDKLADSSVDLEGAGGAALRELLKFRQVQQQFASLLGPMQTANQLMQTLGLVIAPTQELFDAFASDARRTYDALIAGGATAQEAMVLMQPSLQTLWELWKSGKIAIDDETAALLRQAEIEGLIGTDRLSYNAQMLEIFKEIKVAIDAMTLAIQGWGDETIRQFGRVRGEAPVIGIAVPRVAEVPELASGGLVSRPTLAMVGESGPEAVIPLDRLMAGATGAGVTQHITIQLDGRVLAQTVARELPTQLRIYGVK